MSILDQFARGRLEDPNVPISEALDRIFAPPTVDAGVPVTPEGSIASSAVVACVQVVANTLATLPLPVYKRLPSGGKERAPSHPLYTILHDRPNPEMSSVTFRETMQAHLLLWGNAFAEIERNQANQPKHLWPIHPSRVRVEWDGERKTFWIRNANGVEKPFDRDQILHVPGLSFDGVVGLSPIQYARNAIGLAKATEKFGARFFGNGSRVSGVLRHPNKLSPEGAKRLREDFERIHSGPDSSHRVAVLEEGAEFAQMSVPPNDAQFLETRRFQTEEIARIFRVPLHLIGDLSRSTNNNIEHQSIEFVVHTMRPWTVRWEQALNWDLFGDRSGFFCEFLIDGLLRGDIQSRYAAYNTGRMGGWLSGNDVRVLENMNPEEGLDAYLVPRNMAPADRLDELIDKEVAPAPAPPPSPEPPDPDRAFALPLARLDASRLALEALMARQRENGAAHPVATAEPTETPEPEAGDDE